MLREMAQTNDHDSSSSSSKMMISVATVVSALVIIAVTAVTIMAIDETESAHVDPAINNNSDSGSAKSTPSGSSSMINVLDSQNYETDIVMPTKVSRPGCEETGSCYLPFVYEAAVGKPVTWTNEDSAFHSVTSGTYDDPLGMFDSGYMNPYDSYTLSFDVSGTYLYYCTLHPWMQGSVIVK